MKLTGLNSLLCLWQVLGGHCGDVFGSEWVIGNGNAIRYHQTLPHTRVRPENISSKQTLLHRYLLSHHLCLRDNQAVVSIDLSINCPWRIKLILCPRWKKRKEETQSSPAWIHVNPGDLWLHVITHSLTTLQWCFPLDGLRGHCYICPSCAFEKQVFLNSPVICDSSEK